jgi:hypothetical protein
VSIVVTPLLQQAAPALVNEPPTLLIVGFMLNYGLETPGWLVFSVVPFRAQVFPRAAVMLSIGTLPPFIGRPWVFVAW